MTQSPLLPKILYSRLHPAMPWCKFHQSLVFETPSQNRTSGLPILGLNQEIVQTGQETIILDFVPTVPLNFCNIMRMILGQNMPGKFRVVRVPSINANNNNNNVSDHKSAAHQLETRFYQEVDADRYESHMESIGSYLMALGIEPDSILSWGTTYQLYRRNCWHFCDVVLANVQNMSVLAK